MKSKAAIVLTRNMKFLLLLALLCMLCGDYMKMHPFLIFYKPNIIFLKDSDPPLGPLLISYRCLFLWRIYNAINVGYLFDIDGIDSESAEHQCRVNNQNSQMCIV